MSNTPTKSPIALVINHEGMGQTDPPLQQKLIHVYLRLLDEGGTLPATICFHADGVKLIVEGSPVLEQLKTLEARGVMLLVCQTCLDYFNLRDKIRVGIVGSMPDIIVAQWHAQKVITF